jgi:hypothetical protein
MIPMLCPSCGRRGTVPPDKLNSTLHCKKCNTVFHLDLSGKVILGEPPSAKVAQETSQQKGEFDVIGAVASAIVRLPMAVKVLSGVVVVGFISFLIYRSSAEAVAGARGTTQSLLSKTVAAGESYVSQNKDDLLYMAAPGTKDALDSWYTMMRPRIGDYGKQEAGMDVIVSGDMGAGAGEGQAKTSAVLFFPVKPGESTAEDVAIIGLAWVKPDGDWLLDGKTMLDDATKADAKSKADARKAGAGKPAGKKVGK